MPILTDNRLLRLMDANPGELIHAVSRLLRITVTREGNFFPDKFGDGCGTDCYWNGGGYYGESFTCGYTYPSGSTFYCSSECYCKLGSTTRIFISYSWADKPLVDSLASSFISNGIAYLRDINDVSAYANVKEFMHEAGAARFFIPFISMKYLQSRNCLYEIVQLMESDVNIRVLPIFVDPDVQQNYHSYIDLWRTKETDLLTTISKLPQQGLDSLKAEVSVYNKIHTRLNEFLSSVSSFTLPPAQSLIDNQFLVKIIKRCTGVVNPTVQPPVPLIQQQQQIQSVTLPKGTRIALYIGAYTDSSSSSGMTPFLHQELTDVLSPFIGGTISPTANQFIADPLPAHLKFFIPILDSSFLYSTPDILAAITIHQSKKASILPIFIDKLFSPCSEQPYIEEWQRRAGSGTTTDEAKIRDGIGMFIYDQR